MASYLCTVRGTLAQAALNEQFTFTFGAISLLSASSVATATNTAWKTMWNGTPTLKSIFPASVVFTETTAAEILGLTTGALYSASHVPFSPLLTGNGAGSTPSQLAICVSTRGGTKPNGTPFKGRMYLPNPSQGQIDATTGLLTNPGTIKDAMKVFFDGCISATVIPAIWSRSAGTLYAVTDFKVGDRVDTIRRRRNARAETYVTSPV